MNLFDYPDTEEELYQAAIHVPLDRKIVQAIALIRQMEQSALDLSPDGYYVCFSGGKDSVVLAELFKRAGVKYTLNYNKTTIDPPELIRFMRHEYPELIWHTAEKKPLPIKMAENYGPPTRLKRWCCELYKEHGGVGLFKATGVRAPESPRRKGLWKQVNKDQRSEHTFILCPIIYWTDKDIWRFIRDNDLPYCSLYDDGFKRLGCIGCPFGDTKQRLRQFQRWPRYEALWKRGFQKYWDNFKGVPRRDGKPRWIEKMNSVDDLWQWWISGKAYQGDQADCQGWLW